MKYAHVASLVFNTPLLIAPQRLEAIMNYLRPRFEGRAFEPAAQVEFKERQPGRPYRVTTGGVAVIPIIGTLVHRASWMDAMSSDLTSYLDLTGYLNKALGDPDVKAVLLEVDSPGGSAAGAFDLADVVYAFRKAKPIWAAANEEACSAAYALASGAQRLYVARTGYVGSIGVIWQHMDQAKFDQTLGVKYTVFQAGARKNDFNPHFPVSPEASAWASAEVTRIYEIFINTVARNRGLDPDAIRATEAGLFFGPQAVEAGLADGVASFEEALEMLEAEINPQAITPGGELAAGQGSALAKKEEMDMSGQDKGPRPAAVTPEAGGTQAPDLEAAKREAVKASQERIAAILGAPEAEGREAMAKELAFKTGLSPEEAIAVLATAPKAQGNAFTQAMGQVKNPAVGVDGDGGGANPVAAMVNSMRAQVARTFGSEVKGGIQ